MRTAWPRCRWGDPLKCDPAKVAKDVERGLVTTEGARRYDVVLGPDGGADAQATATLLEHMAQERYDIASAAYAFTLIATLAVSGETSIALLAARSWETLIGGALGLATAMLVLPLRTPRAGQ